MRKTLSILFILLLAAPLIMAQKRTGDIYGKVTDEDGNPLPNVRMTLNSVFIREMNTLTTVRGLYRFIGLPPAKDYTVRAALEGFKAETLERIIVSVASSTEINITLKMGVLEEEVTVTAVSPIIDIKTTKVSHNVDHEVLQSLPSARDPWVIAQMAPGVVIDRENVGGSESGQQSDMIARGSTGGQTTYTIDGMNITDPDAIGASPGYYDFDTFEQIDYTLGGADVTQQTGGINLNIVTRRGGNKVSLGGRIFWTESGFQAKKEEKVAELQEDNPYFEGIPTIRDIKDYGLNVGAPVIRDKLWLWGSFGVQDIRTVTVVGTNDDTFLQNMSMKLNAQIVPENRLELYLSFGKKNKWGRAASAGFPGGYFQDEPTHFGNPIHKIQDEHMFGTDLFISAKYVYANVGFSLTPMDDLDFNQVPWYDTTINVWVGPEGELGGYRRSEYIRPVHTAAVRTTYFNDSLFGASHEMFFGVEYSMRGGSTVSERQGHQDITWNLDWNDVYKNAAGEWQSGEDVGERFFYWDIDRYQEEWGEIRHLQAYFRDTISFGNFTILAGFRYDIQQPYRGETSGLAVYDHPVWDYICTPEVRTAIDTVLPGQVLPRAKVLDFDGNPFKMWDISPRLGVTWDMFGDGRTIAKLSFSRYTNLIDIDWGENWKYAGLGGDIQFYWNDYLGEERYVAEMDELFWYWVDAGPEYQLYRVFDDDGNFIGDAEDAKGEWYSGYDIDNPNAFGKYHYTEYDKDCGTLHTTEVMATFQRELFPDFGLTVNGTWRRYDNYKWDLDMWLDADENVAYIQDYDMYIQGPAIPVQIPEGLIPDDYEWDGYIGENAANSPWFYRDPEYDDGNLNAAYSTDYEIRRPRPGYWLEYYGVDFIVNKRFSNRWMFNASFTVQGQRRHWGEKGVMDKSNQWALDGHPYSGGTFSRWIFKAMGLYQLPLGFNVSFFFFSREGFKEDEYFQFRWYGAGRNRRDYRQTIYLKPDNAVVLPPFFKLDLRLEKMLNVGDLGKIYLIADVFNAFNSTIVTNRYTKYWGRFYYYGEGHPRNRFRTEPRPFDVNDVLSPFIARFGIRFEF